MNIVGYAQQLDVKWLIYTLFATVLWNNTVLWYGINDYLLVL